MTHKTKDPMGKKLFFFLFGPTPWGLGPRGVMRLSWGPFHIKKKKRAAHTIIFMIEIIFNQRTKILKSITPIKVMRNQVYLKAAADDPDYFLT